MHTHQVIRIHAHAPAKPPLGGACNGCGVCCAAEPCPVGVILSRRRHGRCAALTWSEPEARYRCGMVSDPHVQLGIEPGWFSRAIGRLSGRLIAAGKGCDSDAETVD